MGDKIETPNNQIPNPKWWAGMIVLLAAVILGIGIWGLGVVVLSDEDEAWPRIRERGVLTIATDASYPPFAAIDADGNYFGFEIDLGDEMARRLGLRATRDVRAEFEAITYDALLASVISGRDDAVISAFVPQMDRLKDVSYTRPYFVGGTVAVVRTGSGGPGLDSARPLPWATDKTFAVEYGAGGDALARLWSRQTTGVTVKPMPTAQDALAALENGQANAALVDAISAYDFLKTHAALQLAGSPLEPEPYVIAVREDSVELLRALEDALAQMEQDGTLPELRVKWFGEAAREQ
jgi:ABC-type amino acid transport substrate-binding protein